MSMNAILEGIHKAIIYKITCSLYKQVLTDGCGRVLT